MVKESIELERKSKKLKRTSAKFSERIFEWIEEKRMSFI